jgi:hypothetical protein
MTMKEKWECVKKKMQYFTKTIYFILLLNGLTILSYFLNMSAIGYLSFSIVVLLLFLFDCDFRAFIPLMFLWFGCFQTQSWQVPSIEFIIMIIFYSIALILFIYRFIRNHKLYISRIKKDYILLSIILIFISMLLSLINSPDLGLSGLGLSHYFMIFCSYFLVRITVDNKEEARDYIVKSIIITALMISIQAGYMILKRFIESIEYGNEFRVAISLGWINSNQYAAILNIASILSIYYFSTHRESILKRIFSMVSILVFFSINLVVASRGGWTSCVTTMVIGIIVYFVYNLKVKKQNILKDFLYIAPLILFGAGIMIYLGINGYLSDIVSRMTSYGFSWNARDVLFEKAIERFKIHPILGDGVYTTNYYFPKLWNYHNYIFQMLGTCGSLGLIFFMFYLYTSIRRSMHFKFYSVFNLIIILYFLIHGFFDTIYFHHAIMPIILVLQAVEHENNINLFEIQYSNILIRREA